MTRKRDVSNSEALSNPGIAKCMDVLTDLLHQKAEQQSIGKPHRIMTKKEYDEFACWGPHVVDLNYEGNGNVAFWFLESLTGVEFERGKDIGKAIGWQQAKDDSAKMLDGLIEAKPQIERLREGLDRIANPHLQEDPREVARMVLSGGENL